MWMHSHEYTLEFIYHFVCGECKNWWSYATTKPNEISGVSNTPYQWREYNGIEFNGPKVLSCPLCSYRTKVIPKI